MKKAGVKQYIRDHRVSCSHIFGVATKKKTEHSESATQFYCQKCLILVNFQDVAESCGEIHTDDVRVAEAILAAGPVEF